MIITINDVRLAGYCASGARRWFEAYSLDFRDFMANGISEERFLATGDAMAIRIVELMRERSNG